MANVVKILNVPNFFVLKVRWQKMALLVFQHWDVCRQKPNVPFAGGLFTLSDNGLGVHAGAEKEAQMFSSAPQ